MTFWKIVNERNPGLKGHCGTKKFLFGGEGGDSIKGKSGANKISGPAVKAEKPGGVAEVNMKGSGGLDDGFDEGVEEFELLPCESAVFIGDG